MTTGRGAAALVSPNTSSDQVQKTALSSICAIDYQEESSLVFNGRTKPNISPGPSKGKEIKLTARLPAPGGKLSVQQFKSRKTWPDPYQFILIPLTLRFVSPPPPPSLSLLAAGIDPDLGKRLLILKPGKIRDKSKLCLLLHKPGETLSCRAIRAGKQRGEIAPGRGDRRRRVRNSGSQE